MNQTHTRDRRPSRLDHIGAAIRMVMDISENDTSSIQNNSKPSNIEGAKDITSSSSSNPSTPAFGSSFTQLPNLSFSDRPLSGESFFEVFGLSDDSDDELTYHHHNYNYENRYRLAFNDHKLLQNQADSSIVTQQKDKAFMFTYPEKQTPTPSSFSFKPSDSILESSPTITTSTLDLATSPELSSSSISSSLGSNSPSTLPSSSPSSSANSSPYSKSIRQFTTLEIAPLNGVLESSPTTEDSSSFHTANGSTSDVALFHNAMAFSTPGESPEQKADHSHLIDNSKKFAKQNVSSFFPSFSMSETHLNSPASSSLWLNHLNASSSGLGLEKTHSVLGGPLERISEHRDKTRSITSIASLTYNNDSFLSTSNEKSYRNELGINPNRYKTINDSSLSFFKSSPDLSSSPLTTVTPRKRKTDRNIHNRLSLSVISFPISSSRSQTPETLKKSSRRNSLSLAFDYSPISFQAKPASDSEKSHAQPPPKSAAKQFKAFSKSIIMRHTGGSASLDQLGVPYSTIPEAEASQLPSTVPTPRKDVGLSTLPPDHPLVLAAAATARTLGHKPSLPALMETHPDSEPGSADAPNKTSVMPSRTLAGGMGNVYDTNSVSHSGNQSSSRLSPSATHGPTNRSTSSSKPLHHRMSVSSLTLFTVLPNVRDPAITNTNVNASKKKGMMGSISGKSNSKDMGGKEHESKFTPIVKLFKRKTSSSHNTSNSQDENSTSTSSTSLLKNRFPFHRSTTSARREAFTSVESATESNTLETRRSVTRKPVHKSSLLDIPTISSNRTSKWEDDPLIEKYFSQKDENFGEADNDNSKSNRDSFDFFGTTSGSPKIPSKSGSRRRSIEPLSKRFEHNNKSSASIKSGASSNDSGNSSSNRLFSVKSSSQKLHAFQQQEDNESKDRADKLLVEKRDLETKAKNLSNEIESLRILIEKTKVKEVVDFKSFTATTTDCSTESSPSSSHSPSSSYSSASSPIDYSNSNDINYFGKDSTKNSNSSGDKHNNNNNNNNNSTHAYTYNKISGSCENHNNNGNDDYENDRAVYSIQQKALEDTLSQRYAELETVQRKSHEVGVLLSRAWKRRRNEGGGEFWVHSVSS